MLEYIKNELNYTHTENGALTLRTTASYCLDLFATAGALRNADVKEIEDRFLRAFTEDADTAMKILFFARDVRGGLGERRFFRVILKWLAENEPATVRKNLAYVAEYGRYDDLLVLMGTQCERDAVALIKEQFFKDVGNLTSSESISLLGKWLPSVNASSEQTVRLGKKIARALGLSDAEYRKLLSALRAKICIIENNLRERDYTFDYEKQASKSLFKYRKAFIKNDKDRYISFLEAANSGKATLNASTLSPYELVDPYIEYTWGSTSFMRNVSEEEKVTLNATWNSLPAFNTHGNSIAVIDTSGSMYFNSRPYPGSVALSLGLYFAEHNDGYFKNHFIEFSDEPQLIEIKGETFADKLRYVASFNKVATTNLEAVFDVILAAAVKNSVPQSELPEKIIIISDMEFNSCVEGSGLTNFECAKEKFEKAGYSLPDVVFWNVASRNAQQPVKANEQGVALVSGCSPVLFSMVAEGTASPYAFMMQAIGGERYACINA